MQLEGSALTEKSDKAHCLESFTGFLFDLAWLIFLSYGDVY